MAERERKEITKADVNAALAWVGKREIEIADTRVPGLSIRVRRESAVWSLRGRLGPKQTTWRIADVASMTAPSKARERATEARSLLARGVDPADWLREQEHGGAVERTFDPEKDGWTWEEAREKFLAFIKKHRAEATHRDYKYTLHGADLKSWDGKLVRSIGKNDVKKLQDAIAARGKTVQATHTLRIVKVMFGWVAERGGSGIDESPAATVKPLESGKAESGRVPTPAEIGALPWLLDAAALAPAARIAAILTLLTAQRRETIASARRCDFGAVAADDPLGGGVWTIPPAHVKSKRGHVVPLPPLTWAIVQAALALGPARSEWLFPQLRLRRAGDEGGGHMSSKAINDALHDAGSPIRPHDCRRAFATHGEAELGFLRSDMRAILDHAEGRSGDVTATHYALHDGRHFKWRVMSAWESWVLERMADRAPQGATWPGFLPRIESLAVCKET